MESLHLIRRKTCKEDKRCMRFNITDEGKQLLQHLNCEQFQLPEQLMCLTK